VNTSRRLQEKTLEITGHGQPAERAAVVYMSSRGTQWFSHVLVALRALAGIGERCMWCSGSESCQVEHFRPKELFPHLSMSWDNFLWSCGLCNNHKGVKFPLLSNGLGIINPLEENVWDYFFIDQFGNLTEKWRVDLNDVDPRAKLTVEVLCLDRDALQQTRQARLRNLRELSTMALESLRTGARSREEVRASLDEWRSAPLQPDVADYFLDGPGNQEEPFRALLAEIA